MAHTFETVREFPRGFVFVINFTFSFFKSHLAKSPLPNRTASFERDDRQVQTKGTSIAETYHTRKTVSANVERNRLALV
ncbi:MAG: hypothetical protein SGI88_05870 [Candidatus Hydrogenedentes bacterium]|nr:hypothetical protein [Candidatus Hydrogenedentota bacterium]